MNYESIRLDKSLYKAEGGFAKQLERLDPTENYAGTELGGLDAFQRQLKRFDIKVGGPRSDTVSKFFATADSAALFPEYVSRAVAQGSAEANLLGEIVAATTDINALDYRTITTKLSTQSFPDVNEGAQIPEVSIALSETLLSLKKRGRLLKASYEAIKHQRVDVITVALRQIGSALARTQLYDAVDCLAFGVGDPVTGVPEAEEIAAAGASFTYDDLLKLWNAFKNFEMNVLLVSPATFRELMSLSELRESTGGDNFISGAGMITPFGAKLFRSDAVMDEQILALDRRFALEMVTAGGVIVEHDKLIDTQLERAAITCTYGFSKLFPDAVKVLVRS